MDKVERLDAPLHSDDERHLIDNLEKLAVWLDAKFQLPGIPVRFGLDGIIGFVPFIGDTISLATSGYILMAAQKLKLPLHIQMVMLWNIFIDWLIGLIPFLGDLFDIGFKANLRNIRLIKDHLGLH